MERSRPWIGEEIISSAARRTRLDIGSNFGVAEFASSKKIRSVEDSPSIASASLDRIQTWGIWIIRKRCRLPDSREISLTAFSR